MVPQCATSRGRQVQIVFLLKAESVNCYVYMFLKIKMRFILLENMSLTQCYIYIFKLQKQVRKIKKTQGKIWGVGILIWGLSLLYNSEIALFVKNVIPVTAS